MILHQPEPGYLEQVTALLKAGKDPRSILDAIQVGCAEMVLETHNDRNFSLPQHCYEYCNTLGWFWDTFAHPQRIKLLYLAASYLNQAARHQKLTGDLLPARLEKPANAGGLGCGEQMADRGRGRAHRARRAQGGRLDPGLSRQRRTTPAPLVQALALACSRLGNDPHNQEIALSACWRTTARTAVPIAAGCCSPPPSIRRGTASTATRSTAAAASARRWGSPRCIDTARQRKA